MQKSFLITGATKGIGLAIAEHLKNLGYQVIGIARNKTDFKFPGFLYLADLTNINETHAIFNLSEKSS